MHTSPNATRRPGRDSAHLTLVITQDEPTVPVAETRPTSGRHAAPAVRVPLAGSATMRALMALGAVLSAIGFSIGRADAVLQSHEQLEEAEPDFAPVPEAVLPPAEAVPDSAPAAPAPVAKAPGAKPAAAVQATASRTTPGHWEPAIAPVKAYTYKLPEPVRSTGKHRKPGAADDERKDRRTHGRHRHHRDSTDQVRAVEVVWSSTGGRHGGRDNSPGWDRHGATTRSS